MTVPPTPARSDMAISLVLADDHPIVLEGLAQLFSHEPDFHIQARCTDGEATLRAVRRCDPDILVLDVRMPGRDGLAILEELTSATCRTRVVLLTAALDEDGLMKA